MSGVKIHVARHGGEIGADHRNPARLVLTLTPFNPHGKRGLDAPQVPAAFNRGGVCTRLRRFVKRDAVAFTVFKVGDESVVTDARPGDERCAPSCVDLLERRIDGVDVQVDE